MYIEFPFFMMVTLFLSNMRYGVKTTLTVAGLVTALYMPAGIFLYPSPDMTYRAAGIVIMTLTALCLTRQRWVHSIFIMASAYMLITVADALSAIGYLVLEWRIIFSQSLLYGILLPLIYIARRPVKGILAQTKKGWWLLCSVPIFMIGCFLLLSAVPVTLAQNPARIPAALIFCGTSIIIYITFFYMMWQLYKQSLLEQNVIALRMAVSDLEHQNELIQQNERRYALFRHDVRHITQMVDGSLAQNDIRGAREWLQPLMENVAAEASYPARNFTGHKLPDAVLSRYIEQAAALGIDIKVRINMGKISADMTELAVVLANALENAVKACTPGGVIRIDGQQRGAQFFLEIANTYSGDVAIDAETGLPTGPAAEDGREHGLGSQSIAFFAEKNGAVLQYQIEGGWFRLRLLI
jgi:signal transduction histidine kinase